MAKTKKPEVHLVENLADMARVPSWELAALRQATGWASGKLVTQAEFDTALGAFRNRPQGGGEL